jgi:hypothetical protein
MSDTPEQIFKTLRFEKGFISKVYGEASKPLNPKYFSISHHWTYPALCLGTKGVVQFDSNRKVVAVGCYGCNSWRFNNREGITKKQNQIFCSICGSTLLIIGPLIQISDDVI